MFIPWFINFNFENIYQSDETYELVATETISVQ